MCSIPFLIPFLGSKITFSGSFLSKEIYNRCCIHVGVWRKLLFCCFVFLLIFSLWLCFLPSVAAIPIRLLLLRNVRSRSATSYAALRIPTTIPCYNFLASTFSLLWILIALGIIDFAPAANGVRFVLSSASLLAPTTSLRLLFRIHSRRAFLLVSHATK